MSARDTNAPAADVLRIGGSRNAPVLALAIEPPLDSAHSLTAAVGADGTVRIVDAASRRVLKGIPSAAFAQSTTAASIAGGGAAQGEAVGPSVCTWLPRPASPETRELLVAAGTSVHVFDIDTSSPAALIRQPRRSYDGVGHDELNALLPLPSSATGARVDAEADGLVDRIAFADDDGNVGTLSLADGVVTYFEHFRKGKTVKAHDRICTSLIRLPSSASAAPAITPGSASASGAGGIAIDNPSADGGDVQLVSGGLDCRVRFWALSTPSSKRARLVAEIDVVAQRAAEAASLQVVNPPYVNCLASIAVPRSLNMLAGERAGVLVAAGLGDGGVLLYNTAEPSAPTSAQETAGAQSTASSEPAPSHSDKNRAERRKAEKAARKLAPKPKPTPAPSASLQPAVVDGVRQRPTAQIVSLAAHGHAVTCLALCDAASLRSSADADGGVVLLTGSADSTLKVWRIQAQSVSSIFHKQSGDGSAGYKLDTTLLRTVRLGGKPNDIALYRPGALILADGADSGSSSIDQGTQVVVALTDGTIAFFALDALAQAD